MFCAQSTDGATLGSRMVRAETGMGVIAVRRTAREAVTAESVTDESVTNSRDDWVVSPGPDTELATGDVLLAKGPRTAAERLRALAGAAA